MERSSTSASSREKAPKLLSTARWADKYSVVPSQSTRFKFNHQPLDLFSASSLSLRDFSDFHHAHIDDSESARSPEGRGAPSGPKMIRITSSGKGQGGGFGPSGAFFTKMRTRSPQHGCTQQS